MQHWAPMHSRGAACLSINDAYERAVRALARAACGAGPHVGGAGVAGVAAAACSARTAAVVLHMALRP